MFSIHGSGVGTGIAIGKAHVIDRSLITVTSQSINEENLESEIAVLDLAIQKTANSLKKTKDDVPVYAPPEIAAFLDAHLLMVQDPMLREATIETMRQQLVDVGTALMMHRNELVDVFDQMEDDYLRSKKNDVDQIIQQILNNLPRSKVQHSIETEKDLKDLILVAHDLTPADTVLFMNRNMGAFVTNLGSQISHVAILARSLRIPAVVGLHGAIRHIAHGVEIAVDSQTGKVIVEPDEDVRQELETRRLENERYRENLLALRDLAPRTVDGHEISLLANVELSSDVDSAVSVGAKGVGLYRTEYLFMNANEMPSEKEQIHAYGEVVKKLDSVTIRTLDLGADKQVDGGREQRNVAINPALGIRAIRFCLRSPGIFRTQLRAIYQVSRLGKVQIMIPMLSNLDEVAQVIDFIEDVKNELKSEGVDFDHEVPIGGMIEVPAAAITADQFAQQLDFLSIGTNDLIQYTLAIDRVDDEVNYLYDPLHPSVLRLIKHVIDAGVKFNKPVSLCGEMASDSKYTRLLLGLGLNAFSMDPSAIPEVKHIIRNSNIHEISPLIDEILQCPRSSQRFQILQNMNINYFSPTETEIAF